MKQKLIKKTTKYQGSFINVIENEYLTSDNHHLYREIVNHKKGVAILAFQNNQVYLVKQYRHAIEDEILEIPAGVVEEGENILECAKRELQEEIGYSASNWQKIAVVHPSCGFTDEEITIFFASELYKSKLPLDEDEYLSVELIPYEELINLIKSQKITDAKSIIAILYFQAFLKK